MDAQQSLHTSLVASSLHSTSYLLLYSSVDAQQSLHTSLVASPLHSTYRTCFYTQHSSVDAQRSIHTSLVASSLHSTYRTCFYVYVCLCSLHSTLQRPITCLVFKVAVRHCLEWKFYRTPTGDTARKKTRRKRNRGYQGLLSVAQQPPLPLPPPPPHTPRAC